MRKSLIEKIVEFIEYRFKAILITLALIIIIPFTTGLYLHKVSADGILSYIGSIITAIISLVVAFIALYQNQQIVKSNEELATMQYRDSIRPSVYLKLNKIGEDLFDITIKNIGEHYATNIHLFQTMILSKLASNEEKRMQINFGNKSIADAINIECLDEYYTTDSGYPEILYLSFNDIDCNEISQEFTLTIDNRYKASPLLYDNEIR